MNERRRLAVLLVELGLSLVAWWLVQPNRPPLRVLAWHTGTRAAQTVARTAGQLALTCESNYWKEVRP